MNPISSQRTNTTVGAIGATRNIAIVLALQNAMPTFVTALTQLSL